MNSVSKLIDLNWEIIKEGGLFVGFKTNIGKYFVRLFIIDTINSYLYSETIDQFDQDKYNKFRYNLSLVSTNGYRVNLTSEYEMLFDGVISDFHNSFVDDTNQKYLKRLSYKDVINALNKLIKEGGFSISTKKDSIQDYSNCPCSICGMKDKWNGPSVKHNNSIRCYQHC